MGFVRQNSLNKTAAFILLCYRSLLSMTNTPFRVQLSYKYLEYMRYLMLSTLTLAHCGFSFISPDVSGKNFLRPNEMNINVATWGRLMKRSLPANCSDLNESRNHQQEPTPTSPGKSKLAAFSIWPHLYSTLIVVKQKQYYIFLL